MTHQQFQASISTIGDFQFNLKGFPGTMPGFLFILVWSPENFRITFPVIQCGPLDLRGTPPPMPLFDYRCDDCQRLNTLLVYSWSENHSSGCENCGSGKLTRLFSKFAVRKSWGDSLNWTPSGETLNDVDDSDPASRETG